MNQNYLNQNLKIINLQSIKNVILSRYLDVIRPKMRYLLGKAVTALAFSFYIIAVSLRTQTPALIVVTLTYRPTVTTFSARVSSIML